MSLYYYIISTLYYDEFHITYVSHSMIIYYNRIVLSPICQSPISTSDKVLGPSHIGGVRAHPTLLVLRAKRWSNPDGVGKFGD